MINVGDSIKYNNVNYIVRHIHNPLFKSKQEVAHIVIQNNNETISLPFTAYYRELYEMETQYSNELEKRWNKLKEHLIKEKEKSLGILSWSRSDEMLKLMERFEEDGE